MRRQKKPRTLSPVDVEELLLEEAFRRLPPGKNSLVIGDKMILRVPLPPDYEGPRWLNLRWSDGAEGTAHPASESVVVGTPAEANLPAPAEPSRQSRDDVASAAPQSEAPRRAAEAPAHAVRPARPWFFA